MSDGHRTREPENLPPKDDVETENEPVSERPSGKVHHPLRGWLIAFAALVPLAAAVGFGAWQHAARTRQVMATAEQQQDFVPNVKTAEVKPSGSTINVSLPATTLAFEAANIFARTNGYIDRRAVDIGDHVKQGDLLALITAPELDHQITQAQATLGQNQATLRETEASRDLAQVTYDRNLDLVKKGWLTPQQGDTDRLTLQAQQSAVGVAQSNVAAQEALIRVLTQQKSYQSVVAPFDGIVTQRSVDNGSLVQAGSTFMFTLQKSDVIRVQVFVPQDAAFGIAPGVDAIVHVPELPNHPVHGKVTRFANALTPGTRTLLTEVDVPNPDGILSPGLYVTIELHIPRKAPSFMVPAEALIFNSDGMHVAVIRDGAAHLKKVTVARDFGTEVEVHDGVNAGDQVILKPAVNLAEGSKVQPEDPQTQVSEREKSDENKK
jgi:RND family efflux transporter MFP subunit